MYGQKNPHVPWMNTGIETHISISSEALLTSNMLCNMNIEQV